MTVRSVPIFLQAGSHPAEETRLMLGGMLGTVTGSFSGGVASSDPAHGVVNQGDLAVTQNGTPNMSVNVSAGGAFIRGTQSANQGAYHVWNDATVNLSVTAADPTNGRRDLVIAQVRDAYYSGATNDARITIVTGTPAASPSDPSLAAFPNALVLARITVAALDTAINTADITSLHTLANVENQIPVFSSTTLRNQFIPVPYNGQSVYLTSDNSTYTYNGSAWIRDGFSVSGATWTPALTATTTNPNIGTAGFFETSGVYSQTGNIVTGWCRIAAGSGAAVNAGSGTYEISLPVPCKMGGTYSNRGVTIGAGYYTDASAPTVNYVCTALAFTTTAVRLQTVAGTISSTLPGLAANDIIAFNFTYEAA